MSAPSTLSISISSLVILLAQRMGLNLGGTEFWTTAELTLYIQQAIREFQVLTGYWRARVQLSTVAGIPYYDLHSSGVVPLTINDTAILQQVGYHLLEFNGTGAFTNTGQFSQGTVTAAFDQRREEILGESRIIVTEYGGNVGPPPSQGRLILSNGVIQIHRCEWLDAPSGLWSLVSETDDLAASGWSYEWPQNPNIPGAFSVATTRPFEVQLIPPPVNNGTLDLLVTACQPYAYNSNTPQLIGLPDDATWVLPWGILTSVLGQDAQSRDYGRAQYASSRFRSALKLLMGWPMVMQSWPGGIQTLASTLHALDHWQSGWRNQPQAQPQTVAVGGRNLIACSPVPDQVYNIPIDAIVNSPASGSTTANFDLAGDIVTAILDCAQHLACFKMGGAEFMATMENYRAFLTVAEANANRERAQAINFNELRGVTNIENADHPYEKVEAA